MPTHLEDETARRGQAHTPPTTDHRTAPGGWPGRPPPNADGHGPEEPQRGRRISRGPSMAALTVAAHRAGTNPGTTPGTAQKHLERYRRTLGWQVAANRGSMNIDGQDQEVLVRKFADISMTAERADGAPRVLTKVKDKERALEILAARENAPATPGGRTHRKSWS